MMIQNIPVRSSKGHSLTWFLYKMVAHFTMRTHGVKKTFRVVECIWLHRKSRQIRTIFRKIEQFYIIRVQHVLSYHLI